MPTDLYKGRSHSSKHKAAVQSSRVCGCFYCLKTFPPSDIDKGETALCPNCGIDTVIGSKSGYKITVGFLRRMCKKWFSV